MSSWRTIAPLCVVLVIGLSLVVGCIGKTRQAFAPNFGSSLVAVHQAMDALANYKKQRGGFPFFVGAPTELEPFGLSIEAASLVQLLDTNATPTTFTTNTICVISIRTTEDSKLGICRYSGLLSGEVVLLPAAQAVLGGDGRSKIRD